MKYVALVAGIEPQQTLATKYVRWELLKKLLKSLHRKRPVDLERDRLEPIVPQMA